MNKKTKKYVACTLLVTSTFMNNSVALATNLESNHWGFSHMEKLVENNIFQGYTDGSLKPEKNMTRAEFVSMINNMYGFKNSSPVDYKDLTTNTWYKTQVEIGNNKNYIGLISKDTFLGNTQITREEASAILGFLLNTKSIDKNKNFNDSKSINPEYTDYIDGLTSLGYITGYENDTFNPKGFITRAEVASIVNKSISKVYNKPGIYKDNIIGNVIINTNGVVLENSNINGNVYIGGDLNSNSIKISNSTVSGYIQLFSNNNKVVTLDNTNVTEISLFHNNIISSHLINNLTSKVTNSRKTSSSSKSSKSNSSSTKDGSKPIINDDSILEAPSNFINKANSKIMDVEGVLYLVINLNTGKMEDYDYFINNEKITMTKVNTSGTILKYELNSKNPFTITLSKDETKQSLTINL